MRFQIPGTDTFARVMHTVETVDSQYNIYDTGIEHADGGIDSLVVGGSFYSLKNFVSDINDRAADRKAKKQAEKTETATAQ